MGLSSSICFVSAVSRANYDMKHAKKRPWPPVVEGRFYEVAVDIYRASKLRRIPVKECLTSRMFEVLQEHAFCLYKILRLRRRSNSNRLVLWLCPTNTVVMDDGDVLFGTVEEDEREFKNFDEQGPDTWMEADIKLNTEEELDVKMVSWKHLAGDELQEARKMYEYWLTHPDKYNCGVEEVKYAGVKPGTRTNTTRDPPGRKKDEKHQQLKAQSEQERNEAVKRPFGRNTGKRYTAIFERSREGAVTDADELQIQYCLEYAGLQVRSITKPRNANLLVAALEPVVKPRIVSIPGAEEGLTEIEQVKTRMKDNLSCPEIAQALDARLFYNTGVTLVYWSPETW